MTKYRIVDFQNTPLSDWSIDRKHLDDYLLTRDTDLGKQRVQSTDDPDYDPDTITSIRELDSLYPDPPANWDMQCGYIGNLGFKCHQSDFDDFHNFREFEKAADAADTEHKVELCLSQDELETIVDALLGISPDAAYGERLKRIYIDNFGQRSMNSFVAETAAKLTTHK